MVRTRADGSTRKAVAAKAPRKALGGANSGGGAGSSMMSPKSGKAGKYAGGNSTVVRPTPDWQKGIGAFMSPGKAPQKENQEPEDGDVEVMEPASSAATSSHAESAEGSSSQGSGSSSNSAAEPTPSGPSSPVKRNGLIESDDDE